MNEDSHNKIESRHLREITSKDMMPRERAEKVGVGALSDAEIMAILLRTGIQGKNVIDLANEILADNDGHLSRMLKLTIDDMTARYNGLGKSKAIGLLASLELGKRAVRDAAEIERTRKPLNSSKEAAKLMQIRFHGLDHEEFWVVALNNALRLIEDFRISSGGTAATVVDVKIIIRKALELKASSLMLFHNHPSGQLKPSPQDDALTRKIKDAAALFDIRVLDHLIMTDSGYFSYNDEGRL